MNKVLSAILITLTSIFIFFPIQMCYAMPEPTISVEPSNLSVSPMETFTVNITVNPDGEEIYSAQYTLHFENNLLQALSQNKGPFLDGNVITNTIDSSKGEVDYGESRTGSGGAINPNVLSTITFKAIGPGVGYLNLSNVILSDPQCVKIPDISLNNRTVKINTTYFDISGFVNYDDGSQVNNPNVIITNLNTGDVFFAETNASSNYYQVSTNFVHVSKGDILHFNASDNMGNTTKLNHTVIPEEIDTGGFMQNISIYIIPDTTPTPTPTPTQTPTPTSGGGDNGNGGTPVAPTQTPGSTPTTTFTPTQTPSTQTPLIDHVPSPSPALITSPPIAPMPTTGENENKRMPGFEATFVILTLFAISFFLWGRRRLK